MIVQLEPVVDNLFREVPLSHTLPDCQPVILSIHGNLFFAAARDLEQRLPLPNGTRCPVVILRLRGDTLLAGTGASMLATYAERLRAQGGKLILCGVEKPVLETLKRTGTLDKIGGENVCPAESFCLPRCRPPWNTRRRGWRGSRLPRPECWHGEVSKW
jgi:anti-anti-sigma regulatory factor